MDLPIAVRTARSIWRFRLSGQAFGPETIDSLARAWASGSGVASEGLLLRWYKLAAGSDGTAMELGAGLSTVVAALAMRGGGRLISMEHSRRWAYRVNLACVLGGLRAPAKHAPLAQQGDADWYEQSALPADLSSVSVVLVDGPPGGTRGGRSGSLWLAPRLGRDCSVLIDDTDRDAEVDLVGRFVEAGYVVETSSDKWTQLRRLSAAER